MPSWSGAKWRAVRGRSTEKRRSWRLAFVGFKLGLKANWLEMGLPQNVNRQKTTYVFCEKRSVILAFSLHFLLPFHFQTMQVGLRIRTESRNRLELIVHIDNQWLLIITDIQWSSWQFCSTKDKLKVIWSQALTQVHWRSARQILMCWIDRYSAVPALCTDDGRCRWIDLEIRHWNPDLRRTVR